MKKKNTWVVIPTQKVNDINFNDDRTLVRSKIGLEYKEIKKNKFSKNTMDVYDGFFLYFNEYDKFEAIEFTSESDVEVDGVKLLNQKIKKILALFPELVFDGYGYIDKKNSIGVTVSESEIVEGILFGKEGYYE